MLRHVLAITSAAAFVATGCREHEVGRDGGVAPSIAPLQTRILYPSAPGSFVDLVASARHGVVGIRATAPVKSGPAAMYPGAPETLADVALGTGFLIESDGVFVLTTDHIAAAASELRVVIPGGAEVPAKLVGRDVRLDLALLSVDVPRLRGLPIGDSDDLQVGEWLVVLGNPFGDEVSATVGIVGATGREGAGSLVPGRAMGFRTFLQTDARIHRGNSGGPVLDTAGQVVGVAVATADRLDELSFAIPINRVKEVIGALRDHGAVTRGWLGVKVKPVTPELAATYGLKPEQGALVTELVAGSPAMRSTLRAGDVILKWGDRTVDHRSLPWLVAQAPVGKPVTVTVWRNRAEQVVPIVTEPMPK
ncbi:MAG: trypsin-like peptidase domain-containing protein [Deltaproteobacteria bacterium]|nr:trypsin-like peptidase domain-containing protein [Deltaproteobacteria bacterium]